MPWNTRITTRSWESPGPRRRPRSRRRSESSRASITRIPSRTTPPPSAGSRRSTRPTPSCPIRTSAGCTTALGRTGRRVPVRARAPVQRPARGAVRATRSVGSRAEVSLATFATSSTRPATRPTSATSSRPSLPAPRSRSPTPAPGAAAGRPVARRSTTSSPGWASIAEGGVRAGGAQPNGGRRTAARSPPQRRGGRRDHARRGVPRHDPPGRGRRQAPRGHDPARAPTAAAASA